MGRLIGSVSPTAARTRQRRKIIERIVHVRPPPGQREIVSGESVVQKCKRCCLVAWRRRALDRRDAGPTRNSGTGVSPVLYGTRLNEKKFARADHQFGCAPA